MQAATKKRRTIDDGNVEPKMRTVPNDQLETAKAFMISMFRQGLGDVKNEWRMLSDEWKSDPDIALAATAVSHKWSVVEVEDLPEQLLQNHGFLVQLMKQRGELWVDLPLAAQNDVSLVDAITNFPSEEFALAIFDRFPRLITDGSFWLKVVAGSKSHVALPLLGEHAPIIILKDSEVALKACLMHHEFLRRVDASLWEQRNFVEAVVNSSADISHPLQHIPDHAQLRWPELVVRCFEYKRDRFLHLNQCTAWAMAVADELWQQDNRVVVRGWFRAGFPFLSHFPTVWKDDREIFLLIAEYCGKNQRFRLVDHECQETFGYGSETLRSSKEFMLQALALNPNVFKHAAGNLQKDFDVVVTAVAHWGNQNLTNTNAEVLAYRFVTERFWDREFMAFVGIARERIERELLAHENFTKNFLPGVTFGGGGVCSLPLLNQGAETEESFKKRIASYLDVPTGKRLRLLRQASKNFPSGERCQEMLLQFEEDFIAEDYSSDEDEGDY